MKKMKMKSLGLFGVGSKLLLMALFVVFAVAAQGATNSCPTGTGTVAKTPAAGPNDSLTNLGAAAATSCTAIDQTFNNFSVAQSSCGGVCLPFTAPNTYAYETQVGTSYNPTVTPTTMNFSTIRGADSVATEGNNNDSINDFVAQHGTTSPATFTDQLAYTDTISSGTNHIYDVVLTVNGVTTAGTSIVFNLFACVGGTQTGIHTSGTCAGGGTLFTSPTYTVTVATGNQTFGAFTFTTPATYIDLSTQFAVTSSGGNTESFISFSEAFQETPEPSTYLLLSTGLGLIGLMSLRRRGKATQS
jgi:hypothetical protein